MPVPPIHCTQRYDDEGCSSTSAFEETLLRGRRRR